MRRGSGLYDGGGRLAFFLLRRERVTSAVWIIALTVFSAALASGIANMFDDGARRALVLTMDNPAIVAMVGPIYGADDYHPGAMYSTMLLLWVAIAVGVMNIFLIVRHTRDDEEHGRLEVIRSLPAGRLANLASALAAAAAVNAAIGLLHSFAIAQFGDGVTMDFKGSLLYGAAMFAIGMVFAGVAALFSQLAQSSGGAVGYSMLALGLFYLVRAAGDAGNEALAVLSPLGLVLRTKIFIENDWKPVLFLLLETAALFAAAFMLNARRDMDRGFIPVRPGRGAASRLLASPLGFAFRLVKTSVIIWAVVMFSLGASYGSIFADIETFVSESELYQMLIGVSAEFSVPEMFVSMVTAIMALVCAVPVVVTALRPLGEEAKRRSEHVLSRGVSRVKYVACYVFISLLSGALFQFATALGLFTAISAVIDDPPSFGFLLKANLLFLPAIWTTAGLAVLAAGLTPKAAGFVWAYYGYSFFAAFVGRMLDLPKWAENLTPFNFIPQLPADEIRVPVLVALTAIAACTTAAGIFFYGKRDMQTA